MSLISPTWPIALALVSMLVIGCSLPPATAPPRTATPPRAGTSPSPVTPIPGSPVPSPVGSPTPGPFVQLPITAASTSCVGRCRHWREVLTVLDERRARIYATGRPRLLSTVYVAGSAALRDDRATLHAWSDRDLAVTGLRLVLLDLVVLHADRRLVRLRVVDRLAGATATLPQGPTISLPHDNATARVLTLRQVAGQWLIATSRHASG